MRTHTHLPIPKFARRSALFLAIMELPMAFMSIFPILSGIDAMGQGKWELSLLGAFLAIGMGIYAFKWAMAFGGVKGKQAANIWVANGVYVGAMLTGLIGAVIWEGSGIRPILLLGSYLALSLFLSVKSFTLIQQDMEQREAVEDLLAS